MMTRAQLKAIASMTETAGVQCGVEFKKDSCVAPADRLSLPCRHALARYALSLLGERLPHMCRMDHDEIRHRDSEHERCPLCRMRDEVAALRQAHRDDVAHLSGKLRAAKKRVKSGQRRASALESHVDEEMRANAQLTLLRNTLPVFLAALRVAEAAQRSKNSCDGVYRNDCDRYSDDPQEFCGSCRGHHDTRASLTALDAALARNDQEVT